MRPFDPLSWYVSLCIDLCRRNAAGALAGCNAVEHLIKTTVESAPSNDAATAEIIPFPRSRARR